MYTQFIQAIKDNNIQGVQNAITSGIDVNSKGDQPDNPTPLVVACLYGHETIVEALLASGATANVANANEFVNEGDYPSPLHAAVFSENINIVQRLLDLPSNRRPNIDTLDLDAQTPLHYAASLYNIPVIELLIQSGANPDKTNVIIGATPALLAIDSDIDFDGSPPGGIHTLQQLAADLGMNKIFNLTDEGCVATLHALLDGGADPLFKDGTGYTLLCAAAKCGFTAIVARLLNVDGIELCAAENGETAIHAAFEAEALDIVQMLVNKFTDQVVADPVYIHNGNHGDDVDDLPLSVEQQATIAEMIGNIAHTASPLTFFEGAMEIDSDDEEQPSLSLS